MAKEITMNSQSATVQNTIPTSQHAQWRNWITQGWTLFKQAPLSLIVLMLYPLVIEGVIQLLPAPTSMILSKWIMVPATAIVWLLVHNLMQTGQLFSLSVIKQTHWKRFILISPILMAPFVCQLAFTWILLGDAGINLILFGQHIEVSTNTLGLIFASALPLSMLLVFITPLMLINQLSFTSSLLTSIRFIATHWGSFSLLVILNMLVVYSALLTFGLSVLLLSPLITCILYAAISPTLEYKTQNT